MVQLDNPLTDPGAGSSPVCSLLILTVAWESSEG